jgi:hypothetical protein
VSRRLGMRGIYLAPPSRGKESALATR